MSEAQAEDWLQLAERIVERLGRLNQELANIIVEEARISRLVKATVEEQEKQPRTIGG